MNTQILLGLTLCFVGIQLTSQAQIEKGDILPGIHLNAFYQKVEQDNGSFEEQSHIYSTASVLYAIDSNNALGLAVGFNYVDRAQLVNLYATPIEGRAGFGLFYQRNLPIVKRLYGYVNTGAYYAFGSQFESVDPSIEINTFSVIARPGLYYFITKRMAFEATFGNMGYYFTRSGEGESRVTVNTLTANFSFESLQYGLRFRF